MVKYELVEKHELRVSLKGAAAIIAELPAAYSRSIGFSASLNHRRSAIIEDNLIEN